MQNIQDLKEKIFFESKNIIRILDKINHADELLSGKDLVDELAEKISFLSLLEKNMQYAGDIKFPPVPENRNDSPSANAISEEQNHNGEVTEEEAIFNNMLNEIDENRQEAFSMGVTEEEAIFNNQLNEIVEGELHETLVNLAEENAENENTELPEEKTYDAVTEEEAVFNNQLNEIDEDENESSVHSGNTFSFVDEERILADSEPENDRDIDEAMFEEKITREETVFNHQLNEIDEFENEISEDEGNVTEFNEEEKIQDRFESHIKDEQNVPEAHHHTPGIYDVEPLEEEDLLIEENEEPFNLSNSMIEQGEMSTETSDPENVINGIRNEPIVEEKQEPSILAEINDRRKIVEINRQAPEIVRDIPASDEDFESQETYQEKKIKLANIKGLKAVQSLFGDDHLEIKWPEEKQDSIHKEEDTGSILKTNIPTGFMEAEKKKPEFKLDLNDKIAFSKTLFGGSQSELNEVVARLNSFNTLEEAKEYLSDLYYSKKWNRVDEYAQRLWILVENKFL